MCLPASRARLRQHPSFYLPIYARQTSIDYILTFLSLLCILSRSGCARSIAGHTVTGPHSARCNASSQAIPCPDDVTNQAPPPLPRIVSHALMYHLMSDPSFRC